MAGPVGFGTSEPGYGPAGIDIPLPPAESLEGLIAEYLRRIADRYDEPKVLTPNPFSLTAFQAVRIDQQGTKVNGIYLTVTSGVVYGYFGEYTNQNGKAPTLPHFCVSAGVVPTTQFFPLPPAMNYVFTIQEAANSTASCVLLPTYV